MTIEEAVLENLKTMPSDKRQEVLDFAAFLAQKSGAEERPRRRASVKGLWIGLNDRPITEEEIAEARREMWDNFPREDFVP